MFNQCKLKKITWNKILSPVQIVTLIKTNTFTHTLNHKFYCLGGVHVVMVTVYVLECKRLRVWSPVGQTEDNQIGICFFSANYQLTCFCELMLDYRVACWSTTKQTDIIITSPKSKEFPWYKEIEIFANILHSSFITCFNQ